MSIGSRRSLLQLRLEEAVLAVIDSHPRALVERQWEWATLVSYGRWWRRHKLLTVHIDGSVTIMNVSRRYAR